MDEFRKHSYVVNLPVAERDGFCRDIEVRRHLDEDKVNDATHEARKDWKLWVGHLDTFGGCNPYHGNMVSLTFPFTKPDRVRLVSYLCEYAFLYDDIAETAPKSASLDPNSHDLVLSHIDSATGAKQIQSKIILELSQKDKACTERIMRTWKQAVSMTRQVREAVMFRDLEQYVNIRIQEAYTLFAEAVMMYGMGIVLTDEEDNLLQHVLRPCHAHLALVNDYFSFDREFEEAQASVQPDEIELNNAVWLCMTIDDIDVAAAKLKVKDMIIGYETEFVEQKHRFLAEQKNSSSKLICYMEGLALMMQGNVVWSLRCPRYHKSLRYDANSEIENQFLGMQSPSVEAIWEASRACDAHGDKSSDGSSSPTPSIFSDDIESRRASTAMTHASSPSPPPEEKAYCSPSLEDNRGLEASEEILAPYEYVAGLPSKGFRDAFIEALNIWLGVPTPTVTLIKQIIARLHNASLLLDDIQDGSTLRRGRPAAHVIFGVPETINSANFAILQATDQVRQLSNPALSIFLRQLSLLYVGQSQDLHWTRHTSCPTEEEYLEMIDKKTGGLLCLAKDLLRVHSPNQGLEQNRSLENLIMQAGRLFQIRDDYMNLASADYTSQKGFCEDLDEGKFSYPMIQALRTQPREPQQATLRNILVARSMTQGLSREMKHVALEQLESSGSLASTKKMMDQLHATLEAEVSNAEGAFGCRNWVIRLLIRKLAV